MSTVPGWCCTLTCKCAESLAGSQQNAAPPVPAPADAGNRAPSILSYMATTAELYAHDAAGLPDAAAYACITVEREGEDGAEVVLPCCEASEGELAAVAASGIASDRARVAAYRDLVAAEDAAEREQDRLAALADRSERRAA